MSAAARLYSQTAASGMTTRELEASALLKAAAKLQAAGDNASPAPGLLDDALDHNRRLWTLFAGAVLGPDSPLADDVKAHILALADFVFNHTIQAQSRKDIGALAVLARINRELAAGLRFDGRDKGK